MKHAANDQPDAGILTGVAETALMTLNGRAHQARRLDAIIDDAMAIRLADAIDYNFDKFGRKGQDKALRSLAFARCAIQYLTEHPDAKAGVCSSIRCSPPSGSCGWSRISAAPTRRWSSADVPRQNDRPVKHHRDRWPPRSTAKEIGGHDRFPA